MAEPLIPEDEAQRGDCWAALIQEGLFARDGALIVNAPSSTGAVTDTLGVICPLLPAIFERLGHD